MTDAPERVRGELDRAPPATNGHLAPDPRNLGRIADDIALQRHRPYVIKGLSTPRSVSVLVAQPKLGKTLWALRLAYHVATGTAFLGRRVQAGAVLYLLQEGAYDLDARLEALRRELGPAPRLVIREVPTNLFVDDTDYRAVLACIRTRERELERGPFALIVIDTFSRVMTGGDENTTRDTGIVMDRAGRLATETGAHVLIIHHEPKDGRGARGSGLITGNCDAVLRLADGRVSVTEGRAGPAGPLCSVNVETVDLGADVEGDPIMGPIARVEAVEQTSGEAAKQRKGKLGAQQKIAFDALAAVICDAPEPPPDRADVPAGAKGVSRATWYAAFTTYSTADVKHRASTFNAAIGGLVANRWVKFVDGYAWLPPQ